jgi:hypothetical protein
MHAPDWDEPPQYVYLVLGVVLLTLSVVCTFTGKAYGPYALRCSRDDQPLDFWLSVGLGYLAGAFFFAVFLLAATR